MSRANANRRRDLATIARDVGGLVLIAAGLMSASVLVAAGFQEWYAALGFLLAGGLSATVGGLARRRFADAPAPKMKHGMVIAAGGWFAIAVVGALPFLFTAWLTPPAAMARFVPADATWTAVSVGNTTTLSSLAYFRQPLHALFESMSGWTGSGLTMAIHEPSLPRSIQWWRSLTQWVGGVGVVVLTVSILARPGSGSYALYRSEAREKKIHPSVVSTVRTVWKLVVGYTVVGVAVLFVAIRASDYGAALPVWDAAWQALNHTMTGLTTGGFSVTDNSIATYDAPVIEAALLPIMVAGAIAFPIHYRLLADRDHGVLRGDLQTRWLFVLLGGGVVVLAAQNVAAVPVTPDAVTQWTPAIGDVPVLSPAQADAARDATFQWVSALTCTGFQSAPIGNWIAGGKILVVGAMTIGGAAGSTVGGIKIIRAYTAVRGFIWQFSRVFLPSNAVVTARIDGRTLDRDAMEQEFSEAAIVALLWVVLLFATSLVLVNLAGPSFSYADALFEVASAQGNVGLSSGITGPDMSPIAEAMFLFNMWIGRLEIIPVLVFARAAISGLDP
ncbi:MULTISPECIES: potassium transporter TrkG [Halobacterium]|uniref:potassium transporter TrkG n=1 Tax=Halobacterium TaxID=2239 RepID=UPI001963022E|nr:MULTISPECIES: potassium transporter TrkG [Halobacterium]MCF2164815.1 potassium transporter Trk [Halobacterium salinarum]MCF2168560.1 potassium transporter Trk [Halobacterium salinarum]MCF2239261.1 potassium transporter Trk [Halobacterium salinarum]MDL0122446.1 potassium transporter TrkG [Halobacterium salinarum]MDL0126969.1 potassium transporter TrkG [Halobacterium salinarum]